MTSKMVVWKWKPTLFVYNNKFMHVVVFAGFWPMKLHVTLSQVYYLPIKPVYNQNVLPTVFTDLPIFRYIFLRERITVVHGHSVRLFLFYFVIFWSCNVAIILWIISFNDCILLCQIGRIEVIFKMKENTHELH